MKKSKESYKKETYTVYKEGSDIPIAKFWKKPGLRQQIYFTPFGEVLFHAAMVSSLDIENKKVMVRKLVVTEAKNPKKSYVFLA